MSVSNGHLSWLIREVDKTTLILVLIQCSIWHLVLLHLITPEKLCFKSIFEMKYCLYKFDFSFSKLEKIIFINENQGERQMMKSNMGSK